MNPDLNTLSEADQIAAVEQYGYAISFIKNPSEAVQLAAVKQAGHVLDRIKNPSEAVQLAAVQNAGEVIQYIKHPSEAVQLIAMERSEEAVRFIPNPSDALLATHLIHHPRSEHTPKAVLDRAEEILEAYCPGLGDVWMMGLSLAMSGDEFKRMLVAHVEMTKTPCTETPHGP